MPVCDVSVWPLLLYVGIVMYVAGVCTAVWWTES